MTRWCRPALAVLATTTVLTACGHDPSVIELRGIAGQVIDYPTDPDIALVRVGDPDGFPTVVIGGDGWVYTPMSGDARPVRGSAGPGVTGRAPLIGPSAAVVMEPSAAPMPPMPTPMQRRRLTADGMERVLGLADRLGLLAEPGEYADPQITDVGSTYVSLTDDAGTYEHIAYALGIEDESGNRRRLLEFVSALGDLERLVGAANLGPAEPYVPERYVVSVQGAFATEGFATTWPKGVPVVEGCVTLPVEQFAPGVSGVYVADVDGRRIRVNVVPDLPGDVCS